MSLRLTLSTVALGVATMLGGCSAIPAMEYDKGPSTTPNLALQNTSKLSGWDDTAVITEGVSSMVLITPMSLPSEVKNRKVDLELEPGATVSDLVAVLGRIGVTAILSDESVSSRKFFLPKYKGTLGGLLSAVTRATDTWFVWHEGVLVVSGTEKIGVTVPQEVDFATELTKGLTSLGVTGSAISWQAGMAVMDLTPRQFTKVRTYLERFTSNAAVVTMQMAIVTVTLNQSAKQGIDWSQLTAAAQPQGTVDDLAKWRSGTATTTTTTAAAAATTTGATGAADASGAAAPTTPDVAATPPATTASAGGSAAASDVLQSASALSSVAQAVTSTAEAVTSVAKVAGPAAVTALALSNGGLSAAVFMDRFSFSGMFGFLQTYGTAETKQNVMLKTVTGSKVEFKSVTQIPYVSSVGVTTTGTTGSNATTGSTTTEKATDGITVQLTPAYDAAANSVTVDFVLSIQSVLGFKELSAGNQIGTLTQPTTAERSFTDKIRVRPGQTVVVGGLTYDSISDSRGAPLYLQKTALESQTLKVERNTTFIVLRPTVTRLGQVLASEAGQSLDLLPEAPDAPVHSASTKSKGAAK